MPLQLSTPKALSTSPRFQLTTSRLPSTFFSQLLYQGLQLITPPKRPSTTLPRATKP
jgi:hypothetical protein